MDQKSKIVRPIQVGTDQKVIFCSSSVEIGKLTK